MAAAIDTAASGGVEVAASTVGDIATVPRSSEGLKVAVRSVLTDEGFSVASEPARNSRAIAARVLQWCDDPCNLPTLTIFTQDLLQLLEECFTTQQLPPRVKREKMWEAYHKLRTSDIFKTKWEDFLKVAAATGPCPIFYQYVTDQVFKGMIVQHFPVSAAASNGADTERGLTYKEINALRYSAGYVPRALHKKLERGSHPLKVELILSLYEMTEEDIDDIRSDSEDWINLVDRGRLKHVNSAVFMLFATMERCVRRRITNARQPTFDQLQEDIATDEDVLFHWAIVSAGWDEEEATALLPMITKLWVTMRGFSYASAWMENYKQMNKKSVQKTKGIRKHLA